MNRDDSILKSREQDVLAKKRVRFLKNKKGMELVQVAILIAIAIVIGLIFKSEITAFVESTFSDLNSDAFK